MLFVETENGSVPLPGSLRAFDGVLAVGLGGGDVLLVDLCWQILDEGIFSLLYLQSLNLLCLI